MRAVLRTSYGAVWLVLVVATFLSWWLGSAEAGQVGSICVLTVAALKVRLVGLHFMEIKGSPLALRVVFDAYVTVLLLAVVLFYVLG